MNAPSWGLSTFRLWDRNGGGAGPMWSNAVRKADAGVTGA